jgi:type IV secretory pathway TrbF-like protein
MKHDPIKIRLNFPNYVSEKTREIAERELNDYMKRNHVFEQVENEAVGKEMWRILYGKE